MYLVPTPSRRHPSAAPIIEIASAIVVEIIEGRADVTNMPETAVTIASPSVIAEATGAITIRVGLLWTSRALVPEDGEQCD